MQCSFLTNSLRMPIFFLNKYRVTGNSSQGYINKHVIVLMIAGSFPEETVFVYSLGLFLS